MSQPQCGEPPGLAGTAVPTAGDVNLGTVSFNVKEEATATISFPGALPPGRSG
jgi:hypothetical protein